MNKQVNEFDQPIGEQIKGWEKRPYPSDMRYVGKYTIITKLKEAHIEQLFQAYRNSHASNWTYLVDEPPVDYDTFAKSTHKKIESNTHVYYTVINKETNAPVGICSLMRIDQDNGVIEIGDINFSDALRKTRMSTEAHLLLGAYVFEELKYRRYEWKCDSLNRPSIKTAKRLGFQYEGTFRNAVIYKGRSRSTSWFSMLIEEWPLIKQAFVEWLDENNFDENGNQIKKIEQFRSK